jgi:iron only hydrogenase large subunit-like protein
MFTGIIKLAQIDDYITPSQKCTQPKILTQDPSKQKGSITLNDCLACSGCITSAETILI